MVVEINMLLISSFIGFFFFNLSFKWFPIELHDILLAWQLLGCPPYNCSCTQLGTHQKRHPSLLVAGINTVEVPCRLRSNAGREFRIQGDARAPPHPPPPGRPEQVQGEGPGLHHSGYVRGLHEFETRPSVSTRGGREPRSTCGC